MGSFMNIIKLIWNNIFVVIGLVILCFFLYNFAFNRGQEDIKNSLIGTADQLVTLRISISDNQVTPYDIKLLIDNIVRSLSKVGVVPDEVVKILKTNSLYDVVRVDEGYFIIESNEVIELTDNKISFGVTRLGRTAGRTHANGYLDGNKFSKWTADTLKFNSNDKKCTLMLFKVNISKERNVPSNALYKLTCG